MSKKGLDCRPGPLRLGAGRYWDEDLESRRLAGLAGRRRSSSGDGFFSDSDCMHVTGVLSSSSGSPHLRSTTGAASLLSSRTGASILLRSATGGSPSLHQDGMKLILYLW
ncbi:unnamed protein product [Brassica oleracea]